MALRTLNLPGRKVGSCPCTDPGDPLCCCYAALAVWQQHTTDAGDVQDVATAANRATSGLFAAAAALGLPVQPLPDQQLLPPLQLDSDAQAALRRLQERASKTSTELFDLLMTGSVAEWEAMIISSFQAGVSADVQESTIQHQVTQQAVGSSQCGQPMQSNQFPCTLTLRLTCMLAVGAAPADAGFAAYPRVQAAAAAGPHSLQPPVVGRQHEHAAPGAVSGS